jgi:hypothetical protein
MKLSDFDIKPKKYKFFRIKYEIDSVFEKEKFKGYRIGKRDRLLSKVVFHHLGAYKE